MPSPYRELEKIDDHVEQGLDRLIDQYKRKPIFEAWARSYLRGVQRLEDAIWDVIFARMLDRAVGVQLATLGKIVGQPNSGDWDDETYRKFIKVRIRINRSKGNTKDVLEVLNLITATPLLFREFKYACLFIELQEVPVEDAVLVYALLKDTKAAGVKLTLIAPTSDTIQFLPMTWDGVSDPDHAAGSSSPLHGGLPDEGAIERGPDRLVDPAAAFDAGLVGNFVRIIDSANPVNIGRYEITGFVNATTLGVAWSSGVLAEVAGTLTYRIDDLSFGLASDAVTVRSPRGRPYDVAPGPPTISRVSPSSGPEDVDTLVTVTGTGFTGVGFELGPTKIHVGPADGPQNVTSLVVSSSYQLQFRVPLHDPLWPERVRLFIQTPLGSVVKAAAFRYVPAPYFHIESISPTHGVETGGTTVTILGQLFTDVAQVELESGGVIYPMTSFTVDSDEQISAVTGPGAQAPMGLRLRKTPTAEFPDGEVAEFRINNFSHPAYVYDPQPLVRADYLIPSHVGSLGGVTVTVKGVGFLTLGLSDVYYPGAGIPTSFAPITVIDDETATFVVPSATAVASGLNTPVDLGGLRYYQTGVPAPVGIFAPDFQWDSLKLESLAPDITPASGGVLVSVGGRSLDTVTQVIFRDLDTMTDFDVTGSWTAIDQEHGEFTTPNIGVNSTNALVLLIGIDEGNGYVEGADESINLPMTMGPGETVAPTVIAPISGAAAGGDHVVVTVPDSTAITDILIDGDACTGFAIDDATHVSGDTPAHAVGGPYSVTVVSAFGPSAPLPAAFTYV